MVFRRYLLQNHSSVFCHRADPLKAMGLAAPSVSDQTSPLSLIWAITYLADLSLLRRSSMFIALSLTHIPSLR
jgi:hypothetical protein